MNPFRLGARSFRSLCYSTQGSVAVITALVLVAMTMAAGMAVDYVLMMRQRTELQVAADAAAVAAAREIPIANSTTAQVEQVASNYVRTNLGLGLDPARSTGDGGTGGDLLATGDGGTGGDSLSMVSSSMMTASGDEVAVASDSGSGSTGSGSSGSVAINATMNEVDSSIVVEIEREWTPYFSGFLGKGFFTIHAHARAQVVGTEKICVLALDDTSSDTISMTKNAKLEANRCGVYSNSVNTRGISAGSGNLLTAQTACSAGGVSGPMGSFEPYPTTDCPPLPDPLIDRQPPPVGACDFTDHYAFEWEETLQPGVYCGGLSIGQNSRATLEPGIYIIKDGAFTVSSGGAAIGENVGFYLVGDQSTFDFSSKATIEITAPKDGEMAGLLFFEDRDAPLLRNHIISSDNAHLLLGTIYLPKGRLRVSTAKPVADKSAYTAIVARQLELTLNPTLVLNSDYSATEIPVSSALSGVGGRVVLTE
ncbi:MAG: pilus assembly protein TadG-related protein [Hyphomicrobiales bacterium]|nr:pilus assembly protein TadG-related protein [Hyphomicrobiales bacterium]